MTPVRVVIADDNALFREMITDNLSLTGDILVVGTAANGAEALEMVKTLAPDVLICDLVMPRVDGYVVLERLAGLDLPKRPGVIAITALRREDFVARAVSLGVSDYMLKPLNFPVLAQRVRELAEKSRRTEAASLFLQMDCLPEDSEWLG